MNWVLSDCIYFKAGSFLFPKWFTRRDHLLIQNCPLDKILRAYYLPGIVLHMGDPTLNSSPSSWNRNSYYPPFTDDKTEARNVRKLSVVL